MPNRIGELVFFVHGFLKADEENITKKQEAEFKELAGLYLNLSDAALDQLVETKEFTEIKFNAENKDLQR